MEQAGRRWKGTEPLRASEVMLGRAGSWWVLLAVASRPRYNWRTSMTAWAEHAPAESGNGRPRRSSSLNSQGQLEQPQSKEVGGHPGSFPGPSQASDEHDFHSLCHFITRSRSCPAKDRFRAKRRPGSADHLRRKMVGEHWVVGWCQYGVSTCIHFVTARPGWLSRQVTTNGILRLLPRNHTGNDLELTPRQVNTPTKTHTALGSLHEPAVFGITLPPRYLGTLLTVAAS
ncbi:hypothetical protein B0T20DRAFT_391044 [Sordaria brevicollis]|uniref:Uncharacterized protein n=1 Tax=Sordaria brevicollis TaxID=83679 RepID=A0AAE0PJR7_SORBR|nr:hypothetical protein B0T20DRAFT_391044 [Sordaria brevicollis]